MTSRDAEYPIKTSFWGSSKADPTTVLEGDETADIVVVGGGNAAMSTAYFLKQAEPSLDVTIVEQEYLGFGASSRNFGVVPQLARMYMLLLVNELSKDDAQFVINHQKRMLDEFEELVTTEQFDNEFERTRVMQNAYREEDLNGLRRVSELHREFGVDSELISGEEAEQEINIPSFGGLSSGTHAVHQPFKHTQGFRLALLRAGVMIHEGTKIESLEESASGICVRSARGSITADKAVFATGAYTSQLGLGRGVLRSTYVYAMATEPLNEAQLTEIGWGSRHRFIGEAGFGDVSYHQLCPDNRFVVMADAGGGIRPDPGDGSIPGTDEDSHLAAFRHTHGILLRQFPSLRSAKIEAGWGGPLTMTEARLPIVAQVKGVSDRVFLNVGFNGTGVLNTTLSGKFLVGRILGKDHLDPDYDRFGQVAFQFGVDKIHATAATV